MVRIAAAAGVTFTALLIVVNLLKLVDFDRALTTLMLGGAVLSAVGGAAIARRWEAGVIGFFLGPTAVVVAKEFLGVALEIARNLR